MSSNIPPVVLRFGAILDSRADVCIEVNGKHIFAFSEMLRRRSTVWASSLSGDWKESRQLEAMGISAGHGRKSDAVVPKHLINITEYSYDVVRAAIFWLMTDHIEFHPCDSTPTPNPNSSLPTPVPAFDIYRFAHFYEIQELANLALTELKSKFKTATIMGELFHERIGQYPELQHSMLGFVLANLAKVEKEKEYREILKVMLDKQASCHGGCSPASIISLVSTYLKLKHKSAETAIMATLLLGRALLGSSYIPDLGDSLSREKGGFKLFGL